MIKGIVLSVVLAFTLVGNLYSQVYYDEYGFLAGSTVVSCAEVDTPYGVNSTSTCLSGASFSWSITGASSYVINSGGRGVNIKWANNNSPKKVTVYITYGGGCGSPTYSMDVTLAHVTPPVTAPTGLTPTTTKMCAGENVHLEGLISFDPNPDPNTDADPYNDLGYAWSYNKDAAGRVNMPATNTKTTDFALPAFSTGGSIVFYLYTYNTTCPNYRSDDLVSAPQTVLAPAPSAPDLRFCLDGGAGTLSLSSVSGETPGQQYYMNVQDVGSFGPFETGDVIGPIGSSARAYQFYRYAERPGGGSDGCKAEGTTPASNAYSLTVGGSANCTSGLVATASGGTATYSYSVNDGASYQTGAEFSSLTAGNYSVKAKDKFGCVGVSSTVPVFAAVALNVVPKLACPGISDGAVTINATGGQGPFQYSIDGGGTVSSTNIFSSLPSGIYSVYIRDTNGAGCTSAQSYPLGNSPALNIAPITPTHPLCADGFSGSFDVSASGGTGALEYTIGSGYQDESTFTGLPAGSYTVIVRDDNNCTRSSGPVTLTDPAAIVISTLNVSPRSCEEKTDGVIEVKASGGTGARTYSLDAVNYVPEGLPVTSFTGLPSDAYTVYVRDGNGCVKPTSAPFVGVLPAINGNLTEEVPISCFGENDGVLKTSPSGGTGPYTVLWSNGITSAQNPDLGPGDYFVDILDAKGCTKTFNRVLIEPGILDADPVLSNYSGYGVRCAGGSDGAIDLTVTGGTGPYGYTWSNGATTQDINSLSQGAYNIAVVDAHGCDVTLTGLVITAPPAVGISILNEKNISCKNGANGEITIGASGGVGFYEYSLDGATWKDDGVFTGLTAGDYVASIRDANLCGLTTGETLTEPSLLELNISGQLDTSCGESNGSATVAALGGVPSYRYEWRDAGNLLISDTDQAATLQSGDYRAYVYDNNNCESSILVTINDSDGPHVQEQSLTGLTCFESNDGFIAVDITEGQTPYTITWDTQSQDVTSISNVTGGEHWVEVVDATGCRTKKFFWVDFPTALELTVDAAAPLCKGNSDGHIEIEVTGGNPGGYDYQWASGQSGTSISGLAAGTYSVTVQDSKLCTLQEDIILTDPPLFVIDAGGDRTICVGQVLKINAPEDNATYEWTSDAGFSSTLREVSLSVPAKYVLKIINQNGCVAKDSFLLNTSNDLLQADFLSAHEAYAGDTVVLIDISWPVPENISWDFPAGATVVNQYEAYAEVVFASSGVYSIVLNTFLGECIDEYGKSITILDGRPDSGGRKSTNSVISRFEVHPNPSDGRFVISISLNEVVPGKIMMVNLSGNSSALSVPLDGKTEIQQNVTLENIPAGLYFLVLEAGKEKEIRRLIIR